MTKTSGTAPGAGAPEFWTPADEVARQGTGETLRPSAFLAAPPKILLYSHDTFGLGNIRRTLLLSEELIAQYPGASILIVTGSPMIHAFRIPKGIDYIKLPCLYRVDVGRYAARFLVECTAEADHAGARRARHSG
jgi:predicted glycosyltransferase